MRILVTRQVEIELPKPNVHLIDRIARPDYYYHNGSLNHFSRRDIANVQFWEIANVFIEPDLRMQIDLFGGIVKTPELTEALSARALEALKYEGLPILFEPFRQKHLEFFRKLGFKY